MAIHTYKPDEVSLIVGGTPVVGWDEISVKKDEDNNVFYQGTGQETTRTKSNRTLGSIGIKINIASSINADFSAYEASDSTVIVLIKDNSGNSIHSMPEAAFTKMADGTYSKTEAQIVEWTLKGAFVVNYLGGN